MKKYTIIKQISIRSGGHFIGNEGNDTGGLYTLSHFLYFEIRSYETYKYFTNWLKGECAQEIAYGNLYSLIKENDTILIVDAIDALEDENFIFYTKSEDLLQIIDNWLREILDKPEPMEVMLCQDENNKVSVKYIGVCEKVIDT